MSKIIPAFNRLLVKPIPTGDSRYGVKAGKIVTLEGSEAQTEQSTMLFEVLELGNKIKEDGRFSVGDVVMLIGYNTGGLVAYAGIKYMLITEPEILCKVNFEETV